jgi:hypothetical protein
LLLLLLLLPLLLLLLLLLLLGDHFGRACGVQWLACRSHHPICLTSTPHAH